MISSLIIALRNALTLKDGVARHLAVATMQAVKGPETPILVTSSARFGVSLNGTGRFPSNSPVIVNMVKWRSMYVSNHSKIQTLTNIQSCTHSLSRRNFMHMVTHTHTNTYTHPLTLQSTKTKLFHYASIIIPPCTKSFYNYLLKIWKTWKYKIWSLNSWVPVHFTLHFQYYSPYNYKLANITHKWK